MIKNNKNIYITYTLFFMGGFLFQFHRFYLGKYKTGIFRLIYSIVLRTMMTYVEFKVFSIILFIPWVLFTMYDLIYIPRMLKEVNLSLK